ncbi:MAG: hypothetical protein ACRBBR_00680 [Cellvibrionaceae bacterium]
MQADNSTAQAQNTSANGGFFDSFAGFLQTAGEVYSEVVTADNASASPSAHSQSPTAVEGTGVPATFKDTAMKYWWAIAAAVVILLLVLIVVL